MKLVWSEGWLCQGGGGGKKRKLNERWISCEWFFFCLNAALLVTAYIPVALCRKLFGDPCDEPRVHFQTRFHFRARVHYYTRALCSLSAHRHSQQTTCPDLDQSEEKNFLSSSGPGPGPGRVEVRSRSGRSEIDLSLTLFSVFTTTPTTHHTNFFLGF